MRGLLKLVRSSDIYVLSILNKSIKCRPLDWFMPKVTYLGSTSFVIIVAIMLLIYPDEYIQRFSRKFALSLIASTVLVWCCKLMFNRTRPFLKIENLHVRKISIDDYSFPSAHSAVSFSMGIMASAFFPQLGSIFITLASLVAISRVYIGVHYPTDVIIGIIIGTSCSIFI